MSSPETTGADRERLGPSPDIRRRNRAGRVMHFVFLAATCFAIAALATLLWTIIARGGDRLSWSLLTNLPSRKPELAGLRVALFGTLWVISLTAVLAFPVGVGAAIYLEEYAPRSRWTTILKINIANLAGVPSVVYGLLGLGIFVELLNLGRVVIAGALTMALLSLPVIIIASQEALRAVPLSLRQGAYALGATRWQVVRHHVLPSAFPGILTGTILSISRAIGETAPLLVVGAALYLTRQPSGLFDNYSVIPIQIYAWTSRPQPEFRELAAAGIIVLLVLLLTLNAGALILRQHFSNKTRW